MFCNEQNTDKYSSWKSLKFATSKLIAHNAGSLVVIVQFWFCSLLQTFAICCTCICVWWTVVKVHMQFTYQTFILYTLHLPHNQVMI